MFVVCRDDRTRFEFPQRCKCRARIVHRETKHACVNKTGENCTSWQPVDVASAWPTLSKRHLLQKKLHGHRDCHFVVQPLNNLWLPSPSSLQVQSFQSMLNFIFTLILHHGYSPALATVSHFTYYIHSCSVARAQSSVTFIRVKPLVGLQLCLQGQLRSVWCLMMTRLDFCSLLVIKLRVSKQLNMVFSLKLGRPSFFSLLSQMCTDQFCSAGVPMNFVYTCCSVSVQGVGTYVYICVNACVCAPLCVAGFQMIESHCMALSSHMYWDFSPELNGCASRPK